MLICAGPCLAESDVPNLVGKWAGKLEPIGLFIPVLQDLQIPGGEIGVGPHQVGMDRLGESVRDLGAGQHVKVPGEGVAECPVEPVDAVGEEGAPGYFSVGQGGISPARMGMGLALRCNAPLRF